MNPYDLTIPVEELAAYCALTEAEIASLRACPHSASEVYAGIPPEGNRSAYVKRRLRALNLVRPLWCDDKKNDELFFTWQRTRPGDRLLDYLTRDAQ